MAEDKRTVYCGNCGSIAQASDRFCGACGARVPADAQAAAPTGEIPVLVREPPPRAAPPRGGDTRRARWIVPVVLLAVMVASIGALAYAALGPGGGLGASAQSPPEIEEAAPPQGENPGESPPPPDDGSNTASVPPDAADDGERERLRTFVYDYHEAVIGGDWATTYAMLDETSREEVAEEEWTAQQAQRGSEGLPARLESVTIDRNDEVSDSPAVATLYYEDGTEETMTVGVPMAVTSEEEAGEPKRTLTEEEIADLEQTPAGGVTDDLAAEAEEAAGDYYRASGVGDWDYTYDALDSETQALFTGEEWSQKNQWFADNGTTIYHIESVRLDGSSQEPLAEVSVRLTGEDGSSSIRTTFFVNENGKWKHRFGREEHNLFMPDAAYEEFVEAREGQGAPTR